MKKIALFLLIVMPGLAFGQLFPKIPDFKGNIESIVEKRYGKEVGFLGMKKGIYRPNAYSGWKYIYHFNEYSKLTKRMETFQGKVKAEYSYQRDTVENRFVEREINIRNANGSEGAYIEYENFIAPDGKIAKVNYWAFNANEGTRELFLVEKDAEYLNNRLSSFTRNLIAEDGSVSGEEKCKLHYDSSGKLTRIERIDQTSGFSTVISNQFNNSGFISHYSVDLMAELQEYGRNQIQDIYFYYDKQGNWTQMYWKSGEKNRLEAKRKIKYR